MEPKLWHTLSFFPQIERNVVKEIRQWKFPEMQTGIFGRMETALYQVPQTNGEIKMHPKLPTKTV